MLRSRTIARLFSGFLIRGLMAFVAGAVVSIAVAIWAASTDPGKPRWARSRSTVSATGYRFMTRVNMYPFTPVGLTEIVDSEPQIAVLPEADWRELAEHLVAVKPVAMSFALYGAGWPRNCMAWYDWYPAATRAPRLSNERNLIVWNVPWIGQSISIPTRPLWRNLATDSAIFSVPLFPLSFATAPIRRLLRGRKGLCPVCAYDLKRDLAGGCPECGWNRKSVEPAPGT